MHRGLCNNLQSCPSRKCSWAWSPWKPKLSMRSTSRALDKDFGNNTDYCSWQRHGSETSHSFGWETLCQLGERQAPKFLAHKSFWKEDTSFHNLACLTTVQRNMSLPITLDLPLPTLEHLSALCFKMQNKINPRYLPHLKISFSWKKPCFFRKHWCSSLSLIKCQFTVFAIVRAQVSTQVFIHKIAS